MLERKSNRIGGFDFIRVIATLFIIFFHYNRELEIAGISTWQYFYGFGRNLNMGYLGVSLFLILSGAVQTLSIERSESIGAYYRKRVLSMMPAYYIAWFLCYLVCWFPTVERVFNWRILFTVFGIDGYLTAFQVETLYMASGEWFMGYILLVYLIFPLLYKAAKRFPVWTLAIIAALSIGSLLLGCSDKFFTVRLLEVMLGMYFYRYREHLKPWILIPAAVIFLILEIVPLPEWRPELLPGRPSELPLMTEVILVGSSLFLLLYYAGEFFYRFKNPVCRFFQKVLGTMASYSYAAFLVHHLLLVWALSRIVDRTFSAKFYAVFFVGLLVIIAVVAFIVKASADTCVRIVNQAIDRKKKGREDKCG